MHERVSETRERTGWAPRLIADLLQIDVKRVARFTRPGHARQLLAERAIEHRRIRPRTPERNGKIERYQQTLAREWAYGQRFHSSTAARRGAARLG